jgi:16S rRNA (guanine1207-N2)-methyltransferase
MTIGSAQKTLFHPFETGDLLPPGDGQLVLFLGAEPGFGLPAGFKARLRLVQGFRPHYRALLSRGFDVLPRAQGGGLDAALVLVGRHRGQNEARFREALLRVRPGGLILAAGDKKDGADSFRKRVAGLLPLQGHLSKFHGVAFWLERPDFPDGQLPAALQSAMPTLAEDRFHAAAGMFSHDRVDGGSRLLAESLPREITGTVADFCAGWGYLATVLAERYASISSVDLYEADYDSLEAARLNLAGQTKTIGFFWHDLLAEPVDRRYDTIVMNPPFHQGRAADPEIGRRMVAAAASALKPRGRLFMVANRGLPYEAALEAAFAQHGEISRNGGFKVLWARR